MFGLNLTVCKKAKANTKRKIFSKIKKYRLDYINWKITVYSK